MAYSKPYLTVAQQVALLQSRGMAVTDVPKATLWLERIGYYRLSGYWYPFRQSETHTDATGKKTNVVLDTFRAGTEFITVIDLYVFDKKLRMLMLDGIERLEVALRVQIALLLGQRDPWAHRLPVHLHGNFSRLNPATRTTQHQDWLDRTDEAFNKSREEFAKHFRSRYPGESLPIWIASEVWDYGALSVLFGGLKKADQSLIGMKYGISAFSVMETWVRAINVTRNICAHHSRLWNKPSVVQPKWPTDGVAPTLAHLARDTHAQTRLYATAAIIRFMLNSVNPTTTWPIRLKELARTFPTSPNLSLRAAGFPTNWETETLWM